MRLNRVLAYVIILGLLLLVAVAVSGCGDQGEAQTGLEKVELPQSISVTDSLAHGLPQTLAASEDHEIVSTDPHDTDSVLPCAGSSDVSCAPRDVSRFNLFAVIQAGGAYGISGADDLEDVLEKGLDLVGASPTHLAVRGTTVSNSIRCDWRGVARTVAQREKAIRFWLDLAASDPLPAAAEVERRFMAEIDGISAAYPETSGPTSVCKWHSKMDSRVRGNDGFNCRVRH